MLCLAVLSVLDLVGEAVVQRAHGRLEGLPTLGETSSLLN